MLYASLKGSPSPQEAKDQTQALIKGEVTMLYPTTTANAVGADCSFIQAWGKAVRSFKVVGTLWLIVVCYLVCCNSAEAATSAPQISFEEAMISVMESVDNIHSTIQDVSQKVMVSLVTIGLVCIGARIFCRRKTAIFARISIGAIYIIVLFGFCNFVITNGDKMALDVLNSFILASTGSTMPTLGFTNVYNDFFSLVEAFSNLFINQESLIFVLGLIILYAILTGFLLNFALIYISAIFVCNIGVIVFAFAFFKSMRYLALNYVKMVLSYGIKMFCLYIIFFSGLDTFKLLFNAMAMKITAGQLITVQELGLTIFVVCFFLVLSITIPKVMMSLFWGFTPRI